MSLPARIPINRIRPNPQQPRQDFNEEALQELGESIRTQDLIQPIKIMPHPKRPGEWMLVDDGERRLRAMRDVLGWEELEVGRHVVIVENADLTDADRLARSLAANLQRQDLNPIESARALQRLHEMELSDAQIAQMLGKSRAWVANRRRLLQLPPEVQEMVAAGELPERKARALLTWLQYRDEIPQDLIDRLRLWSDDPQRVVRWHLSDKGRKVPWPSDLTLPHLDNGHHQGPCSTCRFYFHDQEKDQGYCLNPQNRCFSARRRTWVQMELQRVSVETGIPVAQEGEARYPTGWEERTALIEAVKRHLNGQAPLPDHLRLLPVKPRLRWEHTVPIDGFGAEVTLGTTSQEPIKPQRLTRTSKAACPWL